MNKKYGNFDWLIGRVKYNLWRDPRVRLRDLAQFEKGELGTYTFELAENELWKTENSVFQFEVASFLGVGEGSGSPTATMYN